MTRRFTLFPTAIGTCAIAWTEAGLVGASLPAAPARLRAAMRADDAGAEEAKPANEAADWARRIADLLGGGRADLSDIPVAFGPDVSGFDRNVYAVARTIKAGETLTYGAVASRVGAGDGARAVGAALGRNPVPIVVPCHRVVAAGGRSGGFSAPGGTTTKLRMLAIERAVPAGAPDLFAGS